MSRIPHKNERDSHVTIIYLQANPFLLWCFMLKNIRRTESTLFSSAFAFWGGSWQANVLCGYLSQDQHQEPKRYLWKMTRRLPPRWVQWSAAKLSSHILHTGRRTVKLFAARIQGNWKTGGPSARWRSLSGSNQTQVMQPRNSIFTRLLHTPSASRHPVYFGAEKFHEHSWCTFVPKVFSHETQLAQQYDVRLSEQTGDLHSV